MSPQEPSGAGPSGAQPPVVDELLQRSNRLLSGYQPLPAAERRTADRALTC